MTDSLTYVYCVVRSSRRPVRRNLPPGVSGSGPIRSLDAGGGVWLIVASVPAAAYDQTALDRGVQSVEWIGRRAMAHEAVVERFLSARAVLPMQLLTLFRSDERALEYVRRHRDGIDRTLSRVERRLEWGLRLTFDEKVARAALDLKHAAAGARGRGSRRHDAAGGVGSGAAYLGLKRDLRDLTRRRLTDAAADAEHVFGVMSRLATEAHRRAETDQAPGSRLLLDAAFLVPARRSDAFRAAVRRNTRNLHAAGVVVTLTGPWPPYNFADPPRRASRRLRVPAGRGVTPRGRAARMRA